MGNAETTAGSSGRGRRVPADDLIQPNFRANGCQRRADGLVANATRSVLPLFIDGSIAAILLNRRSLFPFPMPASILATCHMPRCRMTSCHLSTWDQLKPRKFLGLLLS